VAADEPDSALRFDPDLFDEAFRNEELALLVDRRFVAAAGEFPEKLVLTLRTGMPSLLARIRNTFSPGAGRKSGWMETRFFGSTL
jgi:hypothetical protein